MNVCEASLAQSVHESVGNRVGEALIHGDAAVEEADHAAGMGHDARVMGGKDKGGAGLRVEPFA